jgi:outer membrane protein OmpA-like peptidoglycan-associated protein
LAWSWRGRDEILEMLAEARRRFPGLTFESRTRHVGFGLVIDEARVQDDLFQADVATDLAPGVPASVSDPDDADQVRSDVHPMWDEPVTEQRNVLAVWRRAPEEDQPPIRLNLPVRVTVRHDDLQVHEVTLSFPAALLKRALGLSVDPLEMSLSEVQSLFIAPVGAGFTTHTLARPELSLAPPAPPEEEAAVPDEQPPRRRRHRVLVPLLLALIALVAAGGWYSVQGTGANNQAQQPSSPTSQGLEPTTDPSASAPSTQPSSSKAPTVTEGNPTQGPTRKPNVTLKSDLAFGFNSATLSRRAKAAIDQVAQHVRDASLTGTIYVDGYTDDLGSAAYGQVLSQRRATAVSNYLKSQLIGVPVGIVSTGHGEADPIADNSTSAGRVANRRVTITLPQQ